MKKGIESEIGYDPQGTCILKIKKSRGKLTLDEITEACMEWGQDFYMVLIKAMDAEVGQYYECDDLEGDFVTIYRADDFFRWREKDG